MTGIDKRHEYPTFENGAGKTTQPHCLKGRLFMTSGFLSRHRNALFITFPLIYALISLVNHLCYRTYALDLGLYTNAIWDYAHLRFNDSTTFLGTPQNLLADHFDLILPLVSPFVYIFGSYTLLVFQVVMLYIGGRGVQKFLFAFTQDERTSLFARLYFYLHFGVYAALSFDYHSNVIAACLFPWFLYFVYAEKKAAAYLVLALMLFAKENTALWIFSACLLLPFILKKRSSILIIAATVSLVYFLVVTMAIMPEISGSGKFTQFKYAALGKDYAEAVMTIFTDPLSVIKNMFVNHTGEGKGDLVKMEFWIFFLLSGGIFLLVRPLWLLILVPVFLQKMLHDQVQMWGVNGQYAIELVPFMAIGIFSQRWFYDPSAPYSKTIMAITILLTAGVTIRLMDSTVAIVPKENLRFYQAQHYRTDFNGSALAEAVGYLPDTAAVSCQSFILPHLALRDRVYQFPLVHDARYVLLIETEQTYPLSHAAFKDTLTGFLERSSGYEVLYAHENVYLFYKRTR